MTAVFKREFKAYFDNMTGYIFCAFILLFAGIYTMVLNLKSASANFEYVVGNMAFIFLIAIPILTMRIIAEERKQRTDQLLYSLPLSMSEVVLGKYFAMLAVLLIPTLIMGLYPLILTIFGQVNLIAAYGTIFGFFLLGAGLISIGMFISSLTDNQVVAVVGSFIVILLNYFMGTLADYVSHSATATFFAFAIIIAMVAFLVYVMTKSSVIAVLVGIIGEAALLVVKLVNGDTLYGLFPEIMGKISLFERFYSFPNGVFDMTAVVYLLAVSALFVFFTVQVMEKRRWS